MIQTEFTTGLHLCDAQMRKLLKQKQKKKNGIETEYISHFLRPKAFNLLYLTSVNLTLCKWPVGDMPYLLLLFLTAIKRPMEQRF